MFLAVFFAFVLLVALIVIVRWSLSPPHGFIDGSVRVLATTLAGGLFAFWLVIATLLPTMEGKEQIGDDINTPSSDDVTSFVSDVIDESPVSMDLVAGIGAGLGLCIGLASVSSFKRTA